MRAAHIPVILLAEDNPNDVELTLEALAQHRLANRVTVAHDGVEAMEYLRREGAFRDREAEDPAVVLLDIKMPRKDGLEVLREIRGDPALKRIPVVILTSSREDVRMMIGRRLSLGSPRISRRTSRPSLRGILMSSRTTAGSPGSLSA